MGEPIGDAALDQDVTVDGRPVKQSTKAVNGSTYEGDALPPPTPPDSTYEGDVAPPPTPPDSTYEG